MRKRIGEFLVEKGLIQPSQVDKILQYSQEHGVRFGEAGLALGFYTREKLVEVFGPSFSVDFFYLETPYFPKVTQDLLSVEAIARLGVLPLGFKTEKKWFRTRKLLNLGLLDPARTEVAEEALRLASEKAGAGQIQGTKVFLVLADQFIEVLRQVYGVGDTDLRKHATLDHTLSMFLGY